MDISLVSDADSLEGRIDDYLLASGDYKYSINFGSWNSFNWGSNLGTRNNNFLIDLQDKLRFGNNRIDWGLFCEL